MHLAPIMRAHFNINTTVYFINYSTRAEDGSLSVETNYVEIEMQRDPGKQILLILQITIAPYNICNLYQRNVLGSKKHNYKAKDEYSTH